MESPPSFSTQSEVPPLSEDSGLLVTSGSCSSDSASGWHHIAELQESDLDESLCESTERSERSGDLFNTVKKGPSKVVLTTIDPPPEFQDIPTPSVRVESPASIKSASPAVGSEGVSTDSLRVSEAVGARRWARLLHASPRPPRPPRPASRADLASRLSSSHNSLVSQPNDDSNFVTQAISHDTLTSEALDIADMYNVPFDSDIYAVPVDVVRPDVCGARTRGKRPGRSKRRGRTTPQVCHAPTDSTGGCKSRHKEGQGKAKRHSLPARGADSDLHVTLLDMRKYLHTLYSSSSDSECKNTMNKRNTIFSTVAIHHNRDKTANSEAFLETNDILKIETNNNHNKNNNKNTASMNTKSKKHKELTKENLDVDKSDKKKKTGQKTKMSPVRILSVNLKQSFCNLFRWRRRGEAGVGGEGCAVERGGVGGAARRALPPLPSPPPPPPPPPRDSALDFASSIQKVKDVGWYWGPISVEAAERILSNEPDGSFIVRDSSDDHYIFTLTFKLNGLRHVRIEHEQGNFCFGGCTMFKAHTIVEFIERAVETSRSGRYLFFLNLRPLLGPVRVQLLYPVSRFKHVQSLQHLARFVILKHVRRDLVGKLPLPRRLLDYLSHPHFYSELLTQM